MQAIEFLVAFTLALILTSSLAAALLAQDEKLIESAEDYKKIAEAKKAALAVSLWLNAGSPINLDFHDENISFAIGDRFLVQYKGQVIEIGGVYIRDGSEPI